MIVGIHRENPSADRRKFVKCQTPSKRRTDGRTDRRRESNLVHLWHLVVIILMNFLII